MNKDQVEVAPTCNLVAVKYRQQLQLEVLKKVAQICENEGLRYYLEAGSVLGAIRHKGFIPWDDDIDISLPRPDYNRLINHFRTDSSLKVLDWVSVPDYRIGFAKAMDPQYDDTNGQNPSAIDIFPLERRPRCSFLRMLQKLFAQVVLNIVLVHERISHGYRIPLYRFLGIFFPKRTKKLHQLVDWVYRYRSDWAKESFIGVIQTQYGMKFRIPRHATDYLKHLYGEWEKLPPIESRRPKHENDDAWFYSQKRARKFDGK